MCALGFSAEPPAKSAFDKTVFTDYIRHLMVFNPIVQVKVDDPKPSSIEGLKEVDMHVSYGPNSETLRFFVANDGKHFINVSQGGIYDINEDPFKEDRDKLNVEGAPSFGTPGAALTMVVFSDFECPQCKLEAETLRKNLMAAFPTQVRLYFKDFPLESLHPWAKAAAATGRCILKQGQNHFWAYHDWIYAHQQDIQPNTFRTKVDEFVKSDNLDQIQFGNCMSDINAAGGEVDKEVAEGKALNIDATPTMFINGRRLVGSMRWENLKAIIDADLEYEKAHPPTATQAKADDEKCCEIQIPSPLNK